MGQSCRGGIPGALVVGEASDRNSVHSRGPRAGAGGISWREQPGSPRTRQAWKSSTKGAAPGGTMVRGREGRGGRSSRARSPDHEELALSANCASFPDIVSKSDLEGIGATCAQGQDFVRTDPKQQTLGAYFVRCAGVLNFINSDQETMSIWVSMVCLAGTQCPQTETYKPWAPTDGPVLCRFLTWRWVSDPENYGFWRQKTLKASICTLGHGWVGRSLTGFRALVQSRYRGGYRLERCECSWRGVIRSVRT